MARAYIQRGVSWPQGREPRKGDVVYVGGRKATLKLVWTVGEGEPYVTFARPVDGTFGMTVACLKQCSRLEDQNATQSSPFPYPKGLRGLLPLREGLSHLIPPRIGHMGVDHGVLDVGVSHPILYLFNVEPLAQEMSAARMFKRVAVAQLLRPASSGCVLLHQVIQGSPVNWTAFF